MMGPVGSLRAAGVGPTFRRYGAGSVRVWVAQDQGFTAKGGVLRFHFGTFGWCRIELDEGSDG